MKWKNRLTNYNFWVSIVSAVLLVFQAFDINFDLEYINEIVTAVLGVMVVIGIISDPTKSGSETSSVSEIVSSEGNAENSEEAQEETDCLTDEQSVSECEEQSLENKAVSETINNLISSNIGSEQIAFQINEMVLEDNESCGTFDDIQSQQTKNAQTEQVDSEEKNNDLASQSQLGDSYKNTTNEISLTKANACSSSEVIESIPIDEENASFDNTDSFDNEILVNDTKKETSLTKIETNSFNIVN